MGTEAKMSRWRMLGKAPLAAYMILALCTVLSVAYGANIYRNITERSTDGSDMRTASQFVAMKARQCDRSGGSGCSDGRFYGYEYAGSETFVDMVYHYDGWLMELYQDSEAVMEGGMDDAGDRILPCEGAGFRLDGDAVIAELHVAGHQVQCAVHMRGGVLE